MNSTSSEIEPFFHQATNTVCYVVSDKETKCAAIIDSCLDYDHADGSLDTDHADAVIDYLYTKNLKPVWILETHVHADHLSAAPYIQQKLGGKIGISDRIAEVQMVFGKTFNVGTEF